MSMNLPIMRHKRVGLPWLGTYAYRKAILYGSEIPTAQLVDFPKLISISGDAQISARLGSGGGFTITKADGFTEVPFGLYPQTSEAAGDILVRAKFTLDPAAMEGDVLGYIYYDETAMTTEDKPAVVTNGYAVFMPMEEDPSGSAPQMLKWVTGTNVGTSQGTMLTEDLVTGTVGNALDFDGGDDRITIPGTAALASQYTTIEMIITPAAADGARTILTAFGTPDRLAMALYNEGLDFNISNQLAVNHQVYQPGPGVITAGVKAAIALRVSSTFASAWVNGVNVEQLAFVGTIPAVQNNIVLGSASYPGLIDELKISTSARADEWMSYSFEDDNNNSDTFTLGSEVAYA